jgi:hypothetical protein
MVRVSCLLGLRQAPDAGDERSVRPMGSWRQHQVTSSLPGTEHVGCLTLLAGLTGPLPFLPRHGWLRRNALSPHRVRLSGAPGAPLWTGCSSANRALAGKPLWDGIVAVPEVFDTGCSALFLAGERGQPSASARSGDAGERYRRPGALRLISQTCGHIATHGGTQSVAEIVDIRWLSEQRESTLAPRGAAIPGRRA